MASPHRLAALLAGAAMIAGPALLTAGAGTAQAGPYDDPTMDLPRKTSPYEGVGPASPYVQEIMIDTVVPMKNQAIIDPTEYGYLFRAGQQHSDIEISTAGGRLLFHDRGTASWKWLPDVCRPVDVDRGVAATCAIPTTYSMSHPMLIEVWPRLGNDTLRTTALSGRFDVSFLGDRGLDKAYLGAGDDFVNGAQDNDRAHGGAGRDWLRTGDSDDVLNGGGGADYLVGVTGNDVIRGGAGDDKLFGMEQNDTLVPGAGTDFASCGTGLDGVTLDSLDRGVDCENLSYR